MLRVYHVLLSGGPDSPTILGGDLGFSEAMSRNLEGVHVGFLRRIKGQRAVQQEGGTWRQVASEKVL